MWDCGGQPVFLSVLQAFLTAKTMFMLMFNAQNDLHDCCLSLSYHDGVVTSEEYEGISTQELLLKWMACIDATLTPKGDSTKIPEYPCILPIGTHGDDPKVKACSDTILDQLFQEYKDKRYARLILGKGYIVDNTTSGKGSEADPVYKQVLEQVYKFALSDAMRVDTPITWVLFRKVLKMLAKRDPYPCFSVMEVTKIAEACKIPKSSVPSVLTFYHDLAVFLHYSNIPSLKSTVIADPHWLVQQLAKLLALKGFEKVNFPALWDILRKQGILVEALYTEIWKDLKLSPQAIIDLLDHFLIIAPVHTHGKIHCYGGKEYFVPSVLPPLPITQGCTEAISHGERVASLHIMFPNVRYLPPGFFTRLATTLSKEDGYTIAFGQGIHRNQVSYILGLPGAEIDLLVISECKYSVKVTITCQAPKKPCNIPLPSVCLNTIKTLKKCNKQVCQWLPCITTGLGFHCDECGSTKPEHFVVLKSCYTTESSVSCENNKTHEWTQEEAYWLPLPKRSKSVSVVKSQKFKREQMRASLNIYTERHGEMIPSVHQYYSDLKESTKSQAISCHGASKISESKPDYKESLSPLLEEELIMKEEQKPITGMFKCDNPSKPHDLQGAMESKTKSFIYHETGTYNEGNKSNPLPSLADDEVLLIKRDEKQDTNPTMSIAEKYSLYEDDIPEQPESINLETSMAERRDKMSMGILPKSHNNVTFEGVHDSPLASLGEFTLRNIKVALKDLSPRKYLDLALELNLSKTSVEKHEMNWPRDVERVLAEIIQEWLNTADSASWDTLRTALEAVQPNLSKTI